MKDLVSGIRYDASNVISQAIGPSKEFCMGYLNPGVVGGEGYISTMKLSVVVRRTMRISGKST